jgi:hypothetical protein
MDQLPIFFEAKDFVGLALLLAGTLGVTALMSIWPVLRSVGLFVTVGGIAGSTYVDLEVFSAYWYRGTTRGFEFNAFDVLAFSLLLSSLLRPRSEEPRRYWPASLGFCLLFIVYCLANSLMSSPAIFGLYEVSKLVRGVIYFLAAALHVRRERDLAIVAVALACTVALQSALTLRGRFLFDEYRPAGTLHHPNSLSMYLCLVTPVLIAAACSTLGVWVRRLCWVAIVAAAVAQILTLSRAGLPIFACVCGGTLLWCASWRPSPGRLALGALAVLGLAVLVAQSWPLITARYQQATLREEYFDAEGESRGYYFRQAGVILADRPFGVGFNNWSYWVSRQYGAPLGMHYENYDDLMFAPPSDLLPSYRWAAPAHNLGVLTVAELGWPGAALLLALWLRWLGLGATFFFPRSPDALVRVGVGITFGVLGVILHSFTEWTYRQGQIYLTLSLLVGALVALRAVRRAEAAAADEELSADDEEVWAPDPVAVPAHFSERTS